MNTKLEKLVEQYKKELSQRQLTKKSHLESVREFAGKYHCSPTTAAAVFKHLLAEGIVSSVPGKGYFLQKNPARKKKIGYLGRVPSPLQDAILNDAVGALLAHLESRKDVDVRLLQYHGLINPESGKKLLQNLDGLLLESCYIDDKTLQSLRLFNKPVVLFGAAFYEKRLICSQVMADFSTSLKKFCQYCDLNKYSKIVILETKVRNSTATSKQIIDYLNIIGTTAEVFVQNTNDATAYGNIIFGHDLAMDFTADDVEKTLYIPLSGHISNGIYSYIKESNLPLASLPDILSVNNFESYAPVMKHHAFFTSIDRCSKACYLQAAELLFSELNTPSSTRKIIHVPTELVIRKSIRNINNNRSKQ